VRNAVTLPTTGHWTVFLAIFDSDGLELQLQGSTNFEAWVPLCNFSLTSGPFTVKDSRANEFDRRFYRLASP